MFSLVPSVVSLTLALSVGAPEPQPPTMESPNAISKEGFRQVLTDVDTNLHVGEWSIDADKLDLDTPHRWSIVKTTLRGGKQDGVDRIEVDNGVLSFQIIPTRGMGLWKGRMKGIELGWDSPVDEIVHPSLVNLESRGGLGWLEGFGEWINRCGLASNGSPGVDEVRSNTGAIVPVELTLHGKAAYIPARRVEVVIEPPPSRRIIIRGVVDEVMMFGPKLRLVTEISTVPGSTSLRIDDEIQNLGATPQEMQILYHANFGPPLLEEGSQLLAPVRRVFPRDARAAEGEMRDWNVYGAPDPTFVEQVHFLELFGDADGRTEVVLKNRAGEKGVSLAFSIERLPCLTLWKNTAAKENGYVTGIEPGTNYPNHRKHERARGRVPVLEAKGSYRADLTIEVLPDSAAVTKAAARVAELQTAGKPIVELEPEK